MSRPNIIDLTNIDSQKPDARTAAALARITEFLEARCTGTVDCPVPHASLLVITERLGGRP